jgi:hypothetical protein
VDDLQVVHKVVPLGAQGVVELVEVVEGVLHLL